MSRKPYPSDLTDAQWQLPQPFLAAAKPGGRPRKTDLREVVNAIVHLNREGRTWRALPHDFPPWRTVYEYFAAWKGDGTWDKLNGALRRRPRVAVGRPHTPTTAGIDSQTVKATEAADSRGYDGAKRASPAASAISWWTAWGCCRRRRSRRPPWPTPSPPGRCLSR